MADDRAIRSIATADDVDRAIARLFGSDQLQPAAVIHPTAVWQRGDGELVTLAIGEHTPHSDHDSFVLNLVRARADAIVTTGKILRCEPQLSHELAGPSAVPAALGAWRRRQGKERPPVSVVLTSGRDLDLDHPLFRGANRPILYTASSAADTLARAAGRGIGRIADPAPSLRGAIARLRGQGLESIAIEAGPSTARDLYQPPLVVDELLLSVWEAAELPAALDAGTLVAASLLSERFRRVGASRVTAESGSWRFARYLRA